VTEIIHILENSDGRQKTFDVLFLGAFTKLLKKKAISFVMSVCLRVRMEHLGSHCMDFHLT